MNKKSFFSISIIISALLISTLILSACRAGDDEAEITPTPEAEATPTPAVTATPTPSPYPECDYEVDNPYEVGQIMVVMYHRIADEPQNSYEITADEFRQNLQDLYDKGFRTISVSDYINNHITTLPGYSPVILTFDDGHPTAFSLIEDGGALVPAPGTAVAILEEFYAENPDFGKNASFYISGKDDTFDGEGSLAERLQWLVSNGYEIGNHTWDHSYLNNITAAVEIQRQIALTDKVIRDCLPGYVPAGISYPFGLLPTEDFRSYIRSGEYEGHRYNYEFALLVGDRTTDNSLNTAPNRNGYDPFRISRVRGSNDEPTDLGWRLFEQYEIYPEARYISDGNPDRISVPEKFIHNVNTESIGNKELYIYGYAE